MLIDWFTVAAQIVNFLILVWLLKHFLYKAHPRCHRCTGEANRR
jgi:F0F1-type ATP synthase membrane subunit b/b'